MRTSWLTTVAGVLAILLGTAHAPAQGTIQDLRGGYLGLGHFGVGTTPFAVDLLIDEQAGRRFLGAIVVELDKELVAGTIAESDKCKIVTDGGDDKGSLLLEWASFGGGAAVLVGDGVVVNHEEQYLAAFLRPFDNLGVDWGATRRGDATFLSDLDGETFGVPVDFLFGTTGLLETTFGTDNDGFRLVGTSSDRQEIVLVGVGPSSILTIAGQVKINERGKPTAIVGDYVIETSRGKVLDVGMLSVELEVIE